MPPIRPRNFFLDLTGSEDIDLLVSLVGVWSILSMKYFRAIADNEPTLIHSPLIQGIEKTLAYLEDKGPIGLTKSGSFKRVFVEWAAEAFDWPGHRPADLYAVNKVLNELDFYPLVELHDVLLAMKLGRHFKGEFRLTKQGKGLIGHPGQVFGLLAPFYLLEVDHGRYSRGREEVVMRHWDIYLNVINVEADGGATGAQLREALFGAPEPGSIYDEIIGSFSMQVLRPLCWLGLLERTGRGHRWGEDFYAKTPLWRVAMRLETDRHLTPITRH